MRHINMHVDRETSTRAGAEGTFQIVSLTEDGLDVSDLVEQGVHFRTVAEVEHYLSRRVGDEVEIAEV